MRILFKVMRWPLMISVALALVGNGNLLWAHDSHPHNIDTVHVAGSRKRIEILRDGDGVPHIRAKSEWDVFFGLGYVHAQDRLWQMEFQRRLGNGRLAEILGDAGLPTDKLFRTVGLHRTAAAAWASFSPQERQPIEAYVAGINAYLDNVQAPQLPPEFGLLGIEPEPWRPEDVLAWTKVVAWGQGSNWDHELLRAQLAPKLGVEKTVQLMPAYTADGPIILPRSNQHSAKRRKPSNQGHVSLNQSSTLGELLALNRTIKEHLGLGAEGFGSNNWVLSGERTTTGKPILANDPHLTSQTPSVWYLAHLSGGDLDVIGATIPGAPGVIIGHNGDISWGITTINVDSQDVYVEHVNERNEVEYNGASEPLTIVPETIKVKGQSDVSLKVRISRHGPLISDIVNPTGPALALRWTGNDPADSGLLASLGVNQARNWREFKKALRAHRALDQNYVYADRRGNIGYITAGTIPMRANGDGTAPVPGWTSEFEWTGYVPFDELPQTFNPPQGYIASSNNKVAGDDYPHLIGNNFAAPYRAARVVEMIGSKKRHSPTDVARMQSDVLGVHARELLPIFLQTQTSDERGLQAIELLRGWDARMKGDSPQPAIFEAWYIQLAERLFSDELGPNLWRTYSGNIYMTGMALEAALQENVSWCDDVRTPELETCNDTLAVALTEGLARMAKDQGTDDITAWRWDNVHHAQFPHNPFDANPQLKPVFSRSIPNGGDRFTVNVTSSFRRWDDYDQYHSAAYRQVIDFSNLGNSRFINVPGQSGDPESRHYDDLLERWQRVEYLPMRYDRKTVDGAAHERLELVP